jgi:formylglycine-generating enzyme required for sulfatase activity
VKKVSQLIQSATIVVLLSACGPSQGQPQITATDTPAGIFASATSSPLSQIPGPTAEPSSGTGRVRQTDAAEMVFVPEGEFLMGSDSAYYVEESPQHKVYVEAFWIDKTEVTNQQYNECVGAGACAASGCADDERFNDLTQPVVCVSWHDATRYAAWVGGRLPTEAEWEKAARGTDGRQYPWGEEFDSRRANTWEGGALRSTPVGEYSPQGDSPYGAADMAGNVWEWTSSLHKGYPYNADDGREDPDAAGFRVVRGGSFLLNQKAAYCPARRPAGPQARDNSVGFRVAVSALAPE